MKKKIARKKKKIYEFSFLKLYFWFVRSMLGINKNVQQERRSPNKESEMKPFWLCIFFNIRLIFS